MREYMARLAIDPRFLSLLLVTTYVELALGRIEQQRTMRETSTDARACNRYIEYIHVLAKQAERLFVDTTTQ